MRRYRGCLNGCGPLTKFGNCHWNCQITEVKFYSTKLEDIIYRLKDLPFQSRNIVDRLEIHLNYMNHTLIKAYGSIWFEILAYDETHWTLIRFRPVGRQVCMNYFLYLQLFSFGKFKVEEILDFRE